VLSARPVRNARLDASRSADGEVTLKLPRRRTWWVNLVARLAKAPDYRLLTLDRIGAWVWERCDGEHTVRTLVEQAAAEYKLSRKEAELSMMTYLGQLAQRGVIVMTAEQESCR
jgi:hypothetical protein